MLVSSDPALFAVLVLLLLVLLAIVGRGAKRRAAVDARLLAHATGHPSVGLPRGLDLGKRVAVARDVAHQLREAGLDVSHPPQRSLVAARGEDGQYQVDVLADYVVASYLTNSGVVELARTAGAVAAVRAVTDHARLTTG